MRITAYLGVILMLLMVGIWPCGSAPAGTQNVFKLTLDGPILPVTLNYLERGLEKAESEGGLLLLVIDTPGGLVDTTLEINRRILGSKVPVIVFVSPSGGRAASAGVYILYASHLAAMAPETRLGAATPVTMGGQEESSSAEEMKKKIQNDLLAHLRALARKRNRNSEWAELSVTEGASLTDREALEQNVIELRAENLEQLLERLDGRTVTVNDEEWVLQPGRVVDFPMSGPEHFLVTISHPQVAVILLMIGLYGIIYGLNNPGTLIPESIGVICLVTALFALGSLPINYAGLGLLLLSVVLFGAELMTPTYGALTLAGIVSLMLGGSMLIPAGYPFFRLSTGFLAGLALTTAAFFGVVLRVTVGTMRRQPVTGDEVLIGARGICRARLAPEGMVRVLGENWRAVSPGGDIEENAPVIVVGRRGLTLMVERTQDTEKGS